MTYTNNQNGIQSPNVTNGYIGISDYAVGQHIATEEVRRNRYTRYDGLLMD